MDRREFLRLMAAAGALGTLGPACSEDGQPKTDGQLPPDAGPASDGPVGDGTAGDSGPPPDPRLDYTLRPGDTRLTPYLVIPKLDYYHADDPVWNSWAGTAWTELHHPPHGFWFDPPELGQSAEVVVPVINLGNLTTHHLVIELYEGPRKLISPLAECQLCDRKGPFVLHPGQITGYRMTFTRTQQEGASVAICYDPFFDPRHAITEVGLISQDRKNLGGCDGIKPPLYPGGYGG